MKYNELAWTAFCFYYRSSGDRRYCGVMKDASFLNRLRTEPETLTAREFEEKAILGFINLEHYDLLVSHRLAEKVLLKITELRPEIRTLSGLTLLECNLSDNAVVEAVINIYSGLRAYGLWITGASKIAHLVNNDLFPLLSPTLVKHFGVTDDRLTMKRWLNTIQADLQEVTADFDREGLPGVPEEFLSDRLGYSKAGCGKSLVKLADEYYWLKFCDVLPIPPLWAPSLIAAR